MTKKIVLFQVYIIFVPVINFEPAFVVFIFEIIDIYSSSPFGIKCVLKSLKTTLKREILFLTVFFPVLQQTRPLILSVRPTSNHLPVGSSFMYKMHRGSEREPPTSLLSPLGKSKAEIKTTQDFKNILN